ncbi:MAG: flavin reductase [Chloroflexota bacterium]|jgi:flavin reductase (DIM6/NTAB) family NADH-FMN oxidoreductase RutF
MESESYARIHSLDLSAPIWENFFVIAPLVLVGTKDAGGDYNQAPKHMAFPMGWDNYFGFVCTPDHATHQNIIREKVFTVTYPRPTQVILASLAATARDEDNTKPTLHAVPTFGARKVDGRFVRDGYVFLECELERVIGEFGRNDLIVGRIVAGHVHHSAFRTSGDEDGELIEGAPLLAYLQPGRFARVRDSYPFPFPTEFQL